MVAACKPHIIATISSFSRSLRLVRQLRMNGQAGCQASATGALLHPDA
jgi:hypothetical protein